jgi:transcription elongation GreA/GreB family factor
MSIPRNLRKAIEAGRFEIVEDDWLNSLAALTPDLDHFVGVARALTGSGHREQASMLLEILDEHLRELGSWSTYLELLRRVGALYQETPALHQVILDTLRHLYVGFPSLEGLMENQGLHRAVDDIPKTWSKVEKLRELLQYEVGSIVWMQGKGAGRVVEVNLDLESLKIDFERHAGLRVGLAAAAKLLRSLPAGHILRRKLEEPERLQELKKSDPGELLIAVLGSYETSRSAAEIRKSLAGIVDEKEWSGWWSAARKDPRILAVGGSGRQTYSWATSGGEAVDSVRQSFATADTPGKMELFRKNASRSSELKEEMATALVQLGEQASDSHPELALTLYYLLEREGLDLSEIAWKPESLIARSNRPVDLLAKLKDHAHRERILQILALSRDDWRSVFSEWIKQEEDSRLLTFIADKLLEEAPEQVKAFLDEVFGQPRKKPAAFVWLFESAHRKSLTAGRNPLRLLQQLLDTARYDEFSAFRNRLLRFYQSGGPFPELLDALNEDQAQQADQALYRAPVEEYLRTPLITALHLRFPSLRREEEAPLYATAGAIARRQDELQQLLEVEIPANRRAIEEARALGDLSENFEYKSARQRHEYLSARVSALSQDLGRVRPFDPPTGEISEVRLGCQVELHHDDELPRTLILLGPWESQPDQDIVSYESELGQLVLGSVVGDTLEIDGKIYRLHEIRAYAPAS